MDAVRNEQRIPSVNAKILSSAADGSDEIVEVVIAGKSIKGYKNGVLVDIDPSDIKTMRMFVKDSKGRRVHAFATSPEKGKEAVESFFKGANTSKLNPAEAKNLGENFLKLSEMDQATLVGGIENKLRAGQQITEAEFLIAVKGTPSYRTLPGATPNLEAMQKAFRAGNIDDALKVIDETWDINKVSPKTQGVIARIQQLLGHQQINKPLDALADATSGQRLITAGSKADDVRLLPAKTSGVSTDLTGTGTRTKTGAGAASATDDTVKGPIKVEAWDQNGKRIDAEIVDTTNALDRGSIDITPKPKRITGPGTANDTSLVLSSGEKTTDARAIAQIEGPKKPLLLEGPKPKSVVTTPQVNVLETSGKVWKVTPDGVVLTGNRASRFLNNKFVKTALVAGVVGTATCLLSDLCKRFLDLIEDRATGEADDDDLERFMSSLKLQVDVEKTEEKMTCSWSLVEADGVGKGTLPLEEINKYFKEQQNYSVKWSNGSSQMAGKLSSFCEGDINPCVVSKEDLALQDLRIQYNISLFAAGVAIGEPNMTCNNQGDNGVVEEKPKEEEPKPVAPVVTADEEVPPPTGGPVTKPEETDTEGQVPYDPDPFNILQGNQGQKIPLVPPQPMMIPSDNNGMYISPGYY